MNIEQFLKRLKVALSFMQPIEQVRTVQYYREILEDRVEEGLTEEEAVAEMESVEDIAASLMPEDEELPPVVEYIEKPQKRSAWTWIFLILGFPLWFPLLVAVGAVVLAVVVSLWAVFVTMVVSVAVLALAVVGVSS